MKLLHCHIENFGRLQDLDVDFHRALSIIEEENGWGKSTLAAFLRVMLYGFANERKRSLIENERRRYAPWQNGVYGGTVTLETDGKFYRLERTFGTKDAADDTLVLYDADTNLPVEKVPECPGESWLSIDRESFCRTVFIAQQDCGTEATPGIQAKIGHLETEQGDIADYKDVQAALKKEMDALTPSRKTGELSKLTHEIAALEEDIRREDTKKETAAHLEKQLAAQKKSRIDMEKKLEEDTEQLRQFSVTRQTARNFSMTEEEEERLRELHHLFAEGIPEETELQEAEAQYEEVRHMMAECEKLRLAGTRPKRKERPQATKRNGSSPVAVLVFALFASALMAFFQNKLIAVLLAAAAVVIMILTSIHDKKTGDDEIEVIIRDPVKFPWPDGNVLEAQRMEQELRQKISDKESELREYVRSYYPDFAEDDDLSRKLQQLQYDKKEYQTLSGKEERARTADEEYRQKVEETQQLLWREAGSGHEDLSPDEIREAIDETRMALLALGKQIRQTERQIEDVRGELDQISDEKEKLDMLLERRKTLQHRFAVLEKTRGFLSDARAAFTARYIAPVKESFDSYYRLLSGGDEKMYQLDADLTITAREFGAQRDTAFLSEGFQDLVGLCRRQAMIDAMYEEERPFLVLDDPFVNLDEKKTEQALLFLQKIAQKYQVIYLTCHSSRVP